MARPKYLCPRCGNYHVDGRKAACGKKGKPCLGCGKAPRVPGSACCAACNEQMSK